MSRLIFVIVQDFDFGGAVVCRIILMAAAAATLAGCGGLQSLSLSSSTRYVRADGQSVSTEQLDADQASCASLSERDDRCMLAKGYFAVEEKNAEAKQIQLAQIAEVNRQREEARLAAEKKKQAELERAARRQAAKKKKKPAANAVN